MDNLKNGQILSENHKSVENIDIKLPNDDLEPNS